MIWILVVIDYSTNARKCENPDQAFFILGNVMKIEITSWINGTVLFSHECENNTVKITIEAAVKAGAKLNYAKLNYAKLNGAKLNGAKLNGAELNDAELNGAKLNDAELNYAELNYAELNDAELNGAELNYAELNGAKLNDAELNYAELNYAELNGAKWGTNISKSIIEIAAKFHGLI